MKLISTIKSFIRAFCAYYQIYSADLRESRKSKKKKIKIIKESQYSGQKILLLALYQKGKLRPDVIELLKEAKNKDVYIIAVNTLHLTNHEEVELYFDCYIERPNYGRDFGSYKAGFNHIYSKKWDDRCDRLLLLNDSVFFSRRNLKEFLNNLLSSEKMVIGATENFEIEHHIGSFCISLSRQILADQKVKKYWHYYKLSDIRPIVIKKGEMAFSKVLREVSGGENNIGVIFNQKFFEKILEADNDLLKDIFKLTRTSNLTGWKRLNMKIVKEKIIDCFMFEEITKKFNEKSETKISILKTSFISDNIVGSGDCAVKEQEKIYSNFVKSTALECFVSGSQIHQNGIILYNIGLPIIKLDLLYRGMFNYEDVRRITSLMPQDEAEQISTILCGRPFGGDVLSGWKRYAFYRGLI